ncbi:MAG: helix-hairpin-helix domain-containing protein [Akkermansiaceae bacterium]|nr:helix-hairpin-helix domain-containing protein [Akkermansiaceae bacterium]
MTRIIIVVFCLPFSISIALAQPKPLESLKNCTLVPTDWADGDSFRIRTEDDTEYTIRLYAADCLETGELDETDKRRLRDQRRHFGITDVKGNAEDPVNLAISLGDQAKAFTQERLKRPFTIHTRFHKAPGDGKHERFYAFVETSEAQDLATELVKAGLAQSRGRSTETFSGLSGERYRQSLEDYEDQAAKREAGIWKFTDWEKLPFERDVQRKEDEEDQAASGRNLPQDFRLNPNTAARDDLDRLPGIGETLADAIIEAREDEPFQNAGELMRVPGIKRKTLDKFRQYLEFSMP